MILTLALLAQLSIAQLSPGAAKALEDHRAFEAKHSARLLPEDAYKPHDVWAPFAVGGVVTGVGGLAVLAIILLAHGDVWTSIAIGAVGALAAIVILLVSVAFAIAFAIDNGAHTTRRATPPRELESTWSSEPAPTPPAAVVFRF
jgi:hypothetical protein